jgi:hypothetical protein
LSYDHRIIDGADAARFMVELVQAFETKDMLIQWAQESATCAQGRIDEICDISPPTYRHSPCRYAKKPDGMGRSSGFVQLANEEYIFCVLRCKINRVLCNVPERKISSCNIVVY